MWKVGRASAHAVPVPLLLLLVKFRVDVAYGQIVAGTITALIGSASITRAARSFPAMYGASVQLADQIVTSTNGRLTVTLTDNSQFELTESSTLLISENLLNPNGTRARTTLSLLGGLVRSIVRVTAGVPPNYEVHTPNAVAAARGTTYEVHFTNNETRPGFKNCKEFTDVFDYQGLVLVRSLANPSTPPVLLQSGQKTTVPCGLPILPVAAASTNAPYAGALAFFGIVGAGVGGYAGAGGFDPSGNGPGPGPAAVPEIDPGMAKSGLLLLAGILLLLMERLRRR
jgi:FecR protein